MQEAGAKKSHPHDKMRVCQKGCKREQPGLLWSFCLFAYMQICFLTARYSILYWLHTQPFKLIFVVTDQNVTVGGRQGRLVVEETGGGDAFGAF